MHDAIIIGGGAAGLFCAMTAGKRGRKVVVLEHNSEVGRKIVISGGGRCNFTNIHTEPANFLSQNPHFCKSALSKFTPQDFVDLIRKHKISFYEKKLGQLFCRDNSRAVVEMLQKECRLAGVEIQTNCSVAEVRWNEAFLVETNQGELNANRLVVACGGLSFPKIGATDLGYRTARQFGLKVVDTRPSLVGLVVDGGNYKHLAGVSVDSQVTTGKHSFRENILFTHRGLSGPAVLQISNYWRPDEPVAIDLLPDARIDELLGDSTGSRKDIDNYLGQFLPRRLVSGIAEREFPKKPVGQLSKHEIEQIGRRLNDWTVSFRETEGYDRAEVTLGGVSTDELLSQTMESKRQPGLYFIGEVVDVTGWLGGYNFQWAWASGFAAGNAI